MIEMIGPNLHWTILTIDRRRSIWTLSACLITCTYFALSSALLSTHARPLVLILLEISDIAAKEYQGDFLVFRVELL